MATSTAQSEQAEQTAKLAALTDRIGDLEALDRYAELLQGAGRASQRKPEAPGSSQRQMARAPVASAADGRRRRRLDEPVRT
jgi:hypothetical protein